MEPNHVGCYYGMGGLAHDGTPTAFWTKAQGCRVREATLGEGFSSVTTPTELRQLWAGGWTQPRSGCIGNARRFPGYARVRQPWAGGRTAVGVCPGRKRRCADLREITADRPACAWLRLGTQVHCVSFRQNGSAPPLRGIWRSRVSERHANFSSLLKILELPSGPH
jgi:hypothetical protein